MAVVAATGFFDGVHSGHRAVLRQVNKIASEMGLGSAVVTFWPHPRFILNQDSNTLHLLNTIDEKKELLRNIGIGDVFVVPFSESLSRMRAADFIADYLKGRYGVDTLVIGYDHRLGRENLSGKELASLALDCGMNVSYVEEAPVGSVHVSSTVIRNLLEAGEVNEASVLLGYDYSVTYRHFLSGEKVRPCTGRYDVCLCAGGQITRSECIITDSGDEMVIPGVKLSDDIRITFLRKLS